MIPPLSAIERIEVVRGPMSTLYGSDAMGGVINIITRKVAKEWGGSVQVEASLPESSNQGAAQKTSFYLNGPIQQNKLGIAIRGNYYNRDKSGFDLPAGVNATSYKGIAPPKSDQYTLGAKLTLTPWRGHELWLDAETGSTKYDNRGCELGTLDFVNCNTGAASTAASGYQDYLRFERDQIAIGYRGQLGIGVLESSISHTTNETKGRTLPSEAFSSTDPQRYLIGSARKLKSSSTTWDTKLVTPIGDRNLLSIGTQVDHSVAEDGLPELKGQSKFKQDTWAIFAENEWSITDTRSLLAAFAMTTMTNSAAIGHHAPT